MFRGMTDMDSDSKLGGCASAPIKSPIAGNQTSTGKQARVSLFAIPKMDCPAEERLIRMALEPVDGLVTLAFDLGQRELRVVHQGPVAVIAARLEPLGLGARLVSSTATTPTMTFAALPSPQRERRTLQWLLGLNGTMFVVELAMGWLAQSTGLIADSLDMFADAAVYGSALYAVGRPAGDQLRLARLSGWLQLLLALGALSEVLRRFWLGSAPEPPLMMAIALLALVVNATCLAVLARHREGGVHMRASWIFSTNDVIANLGVILAGALVAWTGTNTPDLIIGTLIALVVLNGARRILRLRA